MNNEILNKVDEIIELINNSDDYKEYLKLKEIISNNEEITSLINKVKSLQKEIVHGYNKELELQETLNTLNNHPIYREYNNKVIDINNQINLIETTLNNYINKKINEN